MAKKTSSATLALYVSSHTRDGYFHVKASAVWVGMTPDDMATIDRGESLSEHVPSDRIRNVSDRCYGEYTNKGALDLYNLEVSSQGNDSDSDRKLYGWEVLYTPHTVNLDKAESMAKALKVIQKRLDTIESKYGRAVTFGQYLLRIADAIGASKIVVAHNKQNAGGWSYDDQQNRVLSLEDGASRVDHLVRQWSDRSESR